MSANTHHGVTTFEVDGLVSNIKKMNMSRTEYDLSIK